MSWCRWGSPCDFTFPVGYYSVDKRCAENECPGSDLYIYESTEGGIVCCACKLRRNPDDPFGCDDFRAQTEDEMLDHIEEHVAAGHHVRQSLRRGADLAVAPEYQWMEDLRKAAPAQSESDPGRDE